MRTLELGADDYIVKPCAMEELVARVQGGGASRLAAARRRARRRDRGRGAADRPVGGAGVRRPREHGADADRVPAPAHARERARARRHPGRAAADALGASATRTATAPWTCSCEAAREDRPPRRLATPSSRRDTGSATASSRSERAGAVTGESGNTGAWPRTGRRPTTTSLLPLPRVEDLPPAWEGYDRERVQGGVRRVLPSHRTAWTRRSGRSRSVESSASRRPTFARSCARCAPPAGRRTRVATR